MSRLDLIHEAQQYLGLQPLYLHLATSKPGQGAEVVEIAILETDGTTALDELVRPRGAIRPQMSGLHGITNEMLRAAPAWAEVYPQVRKRLANRKVAVYNADTCLEVLRYSTSLARLRWEIDEESLIDIRQLFSRFYDRWDPRRNAFQTFSMLEAAQLLGLNTEVVLYRRALEDAALLRAMLLSMAAWKVS
jgi:DNA polymerase III epsilon subunit-like protein